MEWLVSHDPAGCRERIAGIEAARIARPAGEPESDVGNGTGGGMGG
jgi:hypothetical protein